MCVCVREMQIDSVHPAVFELFLEDFASSHSECMDSHDMTYSLMSSQTALKQQFRYHCTKYISHRQSHAHTETFSNTETHCQHCPSTFIKNSFVTEKLHDVS